MLQRSSNPPLISYLSSFLLFWLLVLQWSLLFFPSYTLHTKILRIYGGPFTRCLLPFCSSNSFISLRLLISFIISNKFTQKCSSFLFNTYGISTKHVLQQTLQRHLFTDTYLSRRRCPRSRGCDTRRWVHCPWRCRCHRVGKGHVPHRHPLYCSGYPVDTTR